MSRTAPSAPRPPTALAAPAPAAEAEPELTYDAFLGGRVMLWQPKRGYRAATDPVLLAASCPAEAGSAVLDVGSGVGAAAFCLAARAPGVRVSGVERQAFYATLSRRNAAALDAEWDVTVADIAHPPPELKARSFDHVIANPPYFTAAGALPLERADKDLAYRETAPLAVWIDFCLRRLRPKGTLTLIQRAERLPELLAALEGRAGSAVVAPLWPRAGQPAKRVILRATKDAKGPFRLSAGLILHGADGNAFTAEAEAILRDGAALPLT